MSADTHGWTVSQKTLETITTAYQNENSLPLGVAIDPTNTYVDAKVSIPLNILNRHGLIAGATGTGKTRTLQLLAENLSAVGVPVLVTDVKGDLTGIGTPGQPTEKLLARTQKLGQTWQGRSFPIELLALGELPKDSAPTHVPVRTTLSDIGPLLLAKILGLNTTQEQALQILFAWADQEGLALVDLQDLKAVTQYLTEDGKAELKKIGGVSAATAGVILRAATVLQSQGGDEFFGTPAFDTADLFRLNEQGNGVVSVLAIDGILRQPAIVSSLIMWMLADLFETLPEAGDLDKPKLVFFFDEAHLLFKNATPAFLDQVVQTVKLIRSKGVGIFFITQSPQDIPAEVLGQLGSRIVHGLRAFTPKDVADLKETVSSFPLTDLPLDEVLTTLGTGEAVVTVLSEKGAPLPVAPTRLFAPQGTMGPLLEGAGQALISKSTLLPKYRDEVDPYSAFEKLSEASAPQEMQPSELTSAQLPPSAPADYPMGTGNTGGTSYPDSTGYPGGSFPGDLTYPGGAGNDPSWEQLGFPAEDKPQLKRQPKEAPSLADELMEAGQGMFKSALRSFGTQLGKEIHRTLFGTRKRR